MNKRKVTISSLILLGAGFSWYSLSPKKSEASPEVHKKIEQEQKRASEVPEIPVAVPARSIEKKSQVVRTTEEILSDNEKEERIRDLLTEKDSDLEKYVEMHSVSCVGKVCTIEASAKGNASKFQMVMAAQVQKNPWLGTVLKYDTPKDNPGEAIFQFFND